MSSPSRSAQFAKVLKVVKKYYKPVAPDSNRSVLEHLLFACCLENAHYDVAEESFLALVHNFFDWNEVRVSTVRELSEVMTRLPEPAAAATRVKNNLQSVFEASYSFDLEDLRKLNLGPATERIAKLRGATPFTTAYVVQAALGGHSIPLDSGTLNALRLLEVASDEDVKSGTIAGLERAIAKPKGVEFGSLVHQLGADFIANPYAPSFHEILLEINPAVRDRLPKRRKPSEEAAPAEAKPAGKKEAKPAATTPASSEGKAEPKTKRGSAKKKLEETKADTAKAKAAEEKPAKAEGKPAERKKAAAEAKEAETGKKKSATAKKEPPAKKKDAAEKDKSQAEASKKKEAGKEPGSSGLTKRKPR